MLKRLDIKNLNDLNARLIKLKAKTPPVFGKMSSQHMVEHLSWSLRFSNGRSPQTLIIYPNRTKTNKLLFLDPAKDYPMGILSPLLNTAPPPFLFPGLRESIADLNKELSVFFTYFKKNPDHTPTHYAMGELNAEEWILFHNKHFTHHFKQFNLL